MNEADKLSAGKWYTAMGADRLYRVYGEGHTVIAEKVSWADSQLIAAAPNLLELIKEALGFIEDNGNPASQEGGLREDIIRAVNEAEGR